MLPSAAVGFLLLQIACTSGGSISPGTTTTTSTTSTGTQTLVTKNDGGTLIQSPDAAKGDTPICVPLACASATGQYCGTIGDGCGKTQDCGACPSDQVCGAGGPGICGGGANCTPKFACTFSGGSYCGKIGDGCNHPLDCGDTCPTAGWVCENNTCVGPASVCTPLSCDTAGGGTLLWQDQR